MKFLTLINAFLVLTLVAVANSQGDGSADCGTSKISVPSSTEPASSSTEPATSSTEPTTSSTESASTSTESASSSTEPTTSSTESASSSTESSGSSGSGSSSSSKDSGSSSSGSSSGGNSESSGSNSGIHIYPYGGLMPTIGGGMPIGLFSRIGKREVPEPEEAKKRLLGGLFGRKKRQTTAQGFMPEIPQMSFMDAFDPLFHDMADMIETPGNMLRQKRSPKQSGKARLLGNILKKRDLTDADIDDAITVVKRQVSDMMSDFDMVPDGVVITNTFRDGAANFFSTINDYLEEAARMDDDMDMEDEEDLGDEEDEEEIREGEFDDAEADDISSSM